MIYESAFAGSDFVLNLFARTQARHHTLFSICKYICNRQRHCSNRTYLQNIFTHSTTNETRVKYCEKYAELVSLQKSVKEAEKSHTTSSKFLIAV